MRYLSISAVPFLLFTSVAFAKTPAISTTHCDAAQEAAHEVCDILFQWAASESILERATAQAMNRGRLLCNVVRSQLSLICPAATHTPGTWVDPFANAANAKAPPPSKISPQGIECVGLVGELKGPTNQSLYSFSGQPSIPADGHVEEVISPAAQPIVLPAPFDATIGCYVSELELVAGDKYGRQLTCGVRGQGILFDTTAVVDRGPVVLFLRAATEQAKKVLRGSDKISVAIACFHSK